MTLRIATNDAIYSKSVLEANWNSMKFMNHNNLYQYEMMSWDLMDRVTTQLIIIMVVYALLSGF
jgi:energy-converting hydrogenase Eha subunit G